MRVQLIPILRIPSFPQVSSLKLIKSGNALMTLSIHRMGNIIITLEVLTHWTTPMWRRRNSTKIVISDLSTNKTRQRCMSIWFMCWGRSPSSTRKSSSSVCRVSCMLNLISGTLNRSSLGNPPKTPKDGASSWIWYPSTDNEKRYLTRSTTSMRPRENGKKKS